MKVEITHIQESVMSMIIKIKGWHYVVAMHRDVLRHARASDDVIKVDDKQSLVRLAHTLDNITNRGE